MVAAMSSSTGVDGAAVGIAIDESWFADPSPTMPLEAGADLPPTVVTLDAGASAADVALHVNPSAATVKHGTNQATVPTTTTMIEPAAAAASAAASAAAAAAP